jgi:hypothetical protein
MRKCTIIIVPSVVADPCRPDYPCPVGVKVPSGTDCQSYYQCVTPLDWVFLSNGCPGLYDFDVKQCMCDKDVTCSDIDELCPNGVTTPPTDPGISPGQYNFSMRHSLIFSMIHSLILA